MGKMEAYRQAVAELGDAPAEAVAKYIEEKYGIEIPPHYIPVYRASLKELNKLTGQKQRAKSVALVTADA